MGTVVITVSNPGRAFKKKKKKVMFLLELNLTFWCVSLPPCLQRPKKSAPEQLTTGIQGEMSKHS